MVSEAKCHHSPDSNRHGKKLRILMISDYGYLAGGAELVVQDLSEQLRQLGHDVLIFASKAGRKSEPDKPVIADEWCYGTTSPLRCLAQSVNPMAARQLRKVLNEFRPDAIHLHLFLTQLSPLILKELRNRPVIYTAHWYRTVCMTGLKMLPDGSSCQRKAGIACLKEHCVPVRDWLPLMIQMSTLACSKKNISAVVAISETIRSRLDSEGFAVDKIINLGVKDLPDRPELKSPPRIGFASRLVKEKGGAILLQAFQQITRDVPTAILDIFGDGPELVSLRQQASELGVEDSVFFHGYLQQDELQSRLADAWVQVAPSLFEEPGGVVGFEAAMRGTAMVASWYGGFKDTVIPGKTGYLTPPGDVEELAKALILLLSDKQRAEGFGRASRAWAKEHFSLERVTKQYLDLYHETVTMHDPGASKLD